MANRLLSDGEALRRKYLAALDRETELERRLAGLEQEIKMLTQINREAQRANAALTQEVQELKKQLAMAQTNSRNSSKRPSSDLVKPRGERGNGQRKIGGQPGQPGHPKHERRPLGERELDAIIDHALNRCPECQGPLSEGARAPAVVQQVELVKQPLVEYAEHRGAWSWCARCQKWHCSLPPAVRRGGLLGQ
jgi:regulator of replication initiation timing